VDAVILLGILIIEDQLEAHLLQPQVVGEERAVMEQASPAGPRERSRIQNRRSGNHTLRAGRKD
jgi:hypothetical protein